MAQTDREFWFAAPDVFSNNANFNVPIVVRLTSFSSSATVTISLPADVGFTPIVVNIPANSTQTVDLSPWVNMLQNAPPDAVLNKGLLIRSDNDITAYYEVVSSYCNCNPEIFALKGRNALGNEFYISSQNSYDIDTIRHPPATTSFDIVATLDNTTVTITPSQPIVGHAAGIPFSIVLNKGQTYSATGVWRDKGHHLDGSYVVSDKPIAVTLKDDLVFGDGACADLIGDQTVPVSVIGNEYIVAKGFLTPRDRVFVMAVEDNTSIFLDGSSTASVLLNKGRTWEFDLSNSSTYIRSDKRFYVYHVTGLGCELGSAIIPKLNCTGSTSVNIVRSSNNTFGVMLITQAGNQGNFTVNGSPGIINAASFSAVPGTGGTYVAATIDLSGYLPAGSVLQFLNSTGKFSLGLIDGDVSAGSRYGFFSDFKSSTVTSGQVSICPHGTAQLHAVGGVSYDWSPTAGLDDPHIADPKASPLSNTRYTVTITNADGCVDSAFVNVTIDTPPVPDLSFDQLVCDPLKVHLMAASFTGASYNWMVNGDPYIPGQELTYTFPQTGSYPAKLKVLFANGCTDSITKTIPVMIQPADIIHRGDTAVCIGLPVPLSTKPVLEFCWSPTAGLDNPASANPVATPPVTTRYYFTAKITGANLIVNGDFSNGNTGFSSAYSFDPVNQTEGEYFVGPSPHDWNPNAPASCGDHTNGSGNMMIINGNPTTGINVWQQQITVQPNTTYAFSTWIQSISPFSPAILQFSINGAPLGSLVRANATTCSWQQFYTTWNSGSNTTATISLVNQNTDVQGNDFALDDIAFSPLALQRDSVTITVNDLPIVKAKPDTSVCPGLPVPLQVTGAATYSWTPAATLSDATSATPTAVPDNTTQYIVTGTSLEGCSANDTIDVALYYPPYMPISTDTAICYGDNARLHIDGGASYSWSPAALLDDPTSATPLATLTADTMFRVSITDDNGCHENDSVKVYIRTFPQFVQPLDLTVCDGASGVLGRNDYIHYVYAWQPAADLDDPTAPRPVITPKSSEQFTVMISDSTCPRYNKTFQVDVTVNPNPVVRLSKAHDINCSQPITQIVATGGLSYSWLPTYGLSDTTIAGPSVSIDTTTRYTVIGKNQFGCYAWDTVTVKVRAIGKNLFIVPNAFTPNGDGHNDCYGIQRWGDVQVEEFSIFNRTGVRVFTTRNPGECWDGTFNGHPQPAGAYVYVIRAMTFCGPVVRSGNLTLVR